MQQKCVADRPKPQGSAAEMVLLPAHGSLKAWAACVPCARVLVAMAGARPASQLGAHKSQVLTCRQHTYAAQHKTAVIAVTSDA